MSRQEFSSLNDWMEENYAYLIYIAIMCISSFYCLTSINIIFNSFSLVFAILVPIFLLILIPLLSTYVLMAPIYFIVRYRFQKKQELRQIFGRLRVHPDQSIEQSMRIAMKGTTLWKLGVLIKMWKDLNDNACMRIYRGPYA